MREVRLIVTNDGSHSLFVPELNEHYHSTFGAIQESQFIFINAGFRSLNLPTLLPRLGEVGRGLCILEIGFGTGLNALLTQIEAEQSGRQVCYTSIEAFPVEQGTWSQMNFAEQLGSTGSKTVFERLHLAPWDQPVAISPHFTLHKIAGRLEDYLPDADQFHLVYFDAFGPEVQPALWTTEIFTMLFNSLKSGGTLVTYSVKGTVVRALKAAGFATEKLPGPPGKRHILRAVKK
jgi:tRNA U34 5-methylaminomethyl-2-thiouridine-forming methyltransferase MnmC